MQVDVWSDVVCPWCYIGKRHLEAAIAQFDHGDEVEVVFHSFELYPQAPVDRDTDLAANLSRKYGMTYDQAVAMNDRLARKAAEDGLDLRFDIARPGNTFDAHRVIHLAARHGLGNEAKERLLAAYFTEGQPIAHRDTLVQLATEIGLDGDEVAAMLESDALADDVRADEEAALDLGVTGVPFFLVDRKFAVAGAQPVDVLVMALERAWAKAEQQPA